MNPMRVMLNFFHTANWFERAEQLVELLNSPKLAPALCDDNDPQEAPFDADLLLSKLIEARESAKDPETNPKIRFADRYLIRKKAPKWTGRVGPRWSKFDFNPPVKPNRWPEIFEWGHQLAKVLQPDYGACHRIRLTGDGIYSNWSAGIRLMDLERCGFPWLGERTYLSHRIVERIGLDRLKSSGVEHIEELDWGVMLDLISNPWESDPDTLCQKYGAIMKNLTPTGLFGTYRDQLSKAKPGPNWQREIVE